MAEQRLIDMDALLEDIKAAKENGGMGTIVADTLARYVRRRPAVDPEALTVVRQMREDLASVKAERDALRMNPPVEIQADAFALAVELAKVSAERDAAVKDLYTIKDCSTCALQYTDKCILEECMDPCCSFGSGDVPYKWRGPQKEE